MLQSKRGSLIEAAMNTAIGFVVALASQILVFPMFGIDVPLSTNFGIGAWFTAISIVRSYVIRRWFNDRLHRAAQALAAASEGVKP
jgi:hypothetical protein